MRVHQVLCLVFPALLLQAQDRPAVNPGAALVEDFEKRVGDYAKLRHTLETQLPALKSTGSQEKIVHHEHELARKIRRAREHARQGDIFTAPIAAEFRRLLALAMG